MKLARGMMNALPMVLPGLLASVVSMHSSLWYLPLLFSTLSSLGVITGGNDLVYAGIITSGGAFAYLNRYVSYSETALFAITGVFLLYYLAWRWSVWCRYYSDINTPHDLRYMLLSRHTKTAVNAAFALLLTFVGTHMAFQGYRGTVISATLQFLLLTLIFFFLMTYLLKFLPED